MSRPLASRMGRTARAHLSSLQNFVRPGALLALALAAAPLLRADFPAPWLVSDTSAWYPFNATGSTAAGEIGLADWFDKPAGKYGRVLSQGNKLMYNGKEMKFWGFNLKDGDVTLDKSKVDALVATYAKYGINVVRIHKFLEHWSPLRPSSGPHNFWLLDDSGAAFDRFDYFMSRLKEAGIYVAISPSWHFTISEGDKADIPYWQEFAASYGTDAHPTRPSVSTENEYGSCPGFVYYLSEFQELKIKQLEKFLQHRNPYTGLTYGEDPMVLYTEMLNETSIAWSFKYLYDSNLVTLRQRACTRFCDWLRAKYGTHAGLVAAWGASALGVGATKTDDPATSWIEAGFPNQNLDSNNIPPIPVELTATTPNRQRAYDTIAFQYEVQRSFYLTFKNRLKAASTNYQGELVASNWTWFNNVTNYLNVANDRETGIVDKHFYFSTPNVSLLRAPGAAYLSKAAVSSPSDRPFIFSEWSQSFSVPNTLESRVMIAAYGLGLQGWDGAFNFPGAASISTGIINPLLQFDNQPFNPGVLPANPFLLRMVYRGDVQESSVVAERLVNIDSLKAGTLGFTDSDSTASWIDPSTGQAKANTGIKTTSNQFIPAIAAAMAKLQIRFTDTLVPNQTFNTAPYTSTDGTDTIYSSATGQLQWRVGPGEFDADLIIKTPRTQGVFGFLQQNEIIDLPDVEITVRDRDQYAAIIVTVADKTGTLADTDKVLVLGLARARNTGMEYDSTGKVTANGTAPVLMEPVSAWIRFKRSGLIAATKLDHDGAPNGSVAVEQNLRRFAIDGVNDKTPYYTVGITPNNPVVNPGFDVAANSAGGYWMSTATHTGLGWCTRTLADIDSKWEIASGVAAADNDGTGGLGQIIADNKLTTGTKTLSFDLVNTAATTLQVAVWGVNGGARVNLADMNGPRSLTNTATYVGTELARRADLGAIIAPTKTTVQIPNLNFGTGYDNIIIEFFTNGVSSTKVQTIDNIRIGD